MGNQNQCQAAVVAGISLTGTAISDDRGIIPKDRNCTRSRRAYDTIGICSINWTIGSIGAATDASRTAAGGGGDLRAAGNGHAADGGVTAAADTSAATIGVIR